MFILYRTYFKFLWQIPTEFISNLPVITIRDEPLNEAMKKFSKDSLM